MGKLDKAKWSLLGALIVLLASVAASLLAPSRVISAVDWMASNALVQKARTSGAPVLESRVEMAVDGLRVGSADLRPVLILKEKAGERYLPVWIGMEEARAIGMALEGASTPRPITADLLHSIVNALNAKVEFVVIHDLRDDVFYAKVVLAAHGKPIEIDSRPSDAIALGLRQGARIYVEEKVLNEAGVLPDRKENILA